jgi:hypothetical protein
MQLDEGARTKGFPWRRRELTQLGTIGLVGCMMCACLEERSLSPEPSPPFSLVVVTSGPSAHGIERCLPPSSTVLDTLGLDATRGVETSVVLRRVLVVGCRREALARPVLYHPSNITWDTPTGDKSKMAALIYIIVAAVGLAFLSIPAMFVALSFVDNRPKPRARKVIRLSNDGTLAVDEIPPSVAANQQRSIAA